MNCRVNTHTTVVNANDGWILKILSAACTSTEYTKKEICRKLNGKNGRRARKKNIDQASARLSTYTHIIKHNVFVYMVQITFDCCYRYIAHWYRSGKREWKCVYIIKCTYTHIHTHHAHSDIITKYLKFSSIIFSTTNRSELDMSCALACTRVRVCGNVFKQSLHSLSVTELMPWKYVIR